MHRVDPPDLIFYDPYSFRTNRDLWTLEVFRSLFGLCGGLDTELFSYTASTRLRATMLGAGFHVTAGAGTGHKADTTVALTERAMARRREMQRPLPLLGADWLRRWERSDSRFPFDIGIGEEEGFAVSLRSHGQFGPSAVST